MARKQIDKSEARKNHEIEVAERKRRRYEIEKLVLQGVTDTAVLSVRYGVSKAVIRTDIKWIYGQFSVRDDRNRNTRKATRIAELMNIINKAMVSYERSQLNEVVETVKIEGEDEITTTTTKGQAGDPAFLRVAKDAVVEIAKLDGLYTSKLEIAHAGNGPISQEKVKENDNHIEELLSKMRQRGNQVPVSNN